ncbi:hypothetical protein L873DRAFT_1794334 [Choiromyces venosus 120613-1]|uniref:Uncharacterized protein n=1 Tax=Choiromyces venosus 120613-1 TaxID=1336337 RepID=A0A3N4J6R3_9PEZI|nr:hypothetical protein L873DRAFT_1794334 [Choiromyces venosus 120613-1]
MPDNYIGYFVKSSRLGVVFLESMTSRRSLTSASQGAIIALHRCAEMSFEQIGLILNVSGETARTTYKWMAECSQSYEINDLLAAVNVGDKKREEPVMVHAI